MLQRKAFFEQKLFLKIGSCLHDQFCKRRRHTHGICRVACYFQTFFLSFFLSFFLVFFFSLSLSFFLSYSLYLFFYIVFFLSFLSLSLSHFWSFFRLSFGFQKIFCWWKIVWTRLVHSLSSPKRDIENVGLSRAHEQPRTPSRMVLTTSEIWVQPQFDLKSSLLLCMIYLFLDL